MSLSVSEQPPSIENSAIWRSIVDVSLGLAKLESSGDEKPENLVSLAISAARGVPECVVCENLYASILKDHFGVTDDAIGGLSGNTNSSSQTIFAIGRSSLKKLPFDYSHYLDFVLQETCLALHDVDIVKASDGVLALSAINLNIKEEMGFVHKRFLDQAVASLSMMIELYPHPVAYEVVRAVGKL